MGKKSRAKTFRREAQRPVPIRQIPDQPESFEQPGMVNGYRCPLGHVVYTVIRDAGTTPSGMLCRHVEKRGFPVVEVECNLRSTSMFYRVVDPIGVTVTYEWYRPDGAERRTLDRYQAEHVNMGGLLIQPLAEPVFVAAVAS